MAIFRKIHVSFWSDSFISELSDKSKLFYLYLITNERTTQLGVYEITKKQMAFDLGYNLETICKLISEFQKANKIMYNEKTCEVSIKNWNRYNFNPSSKVKVLIDKEKAKVKDKKLIEYQYSIDTVPIYNPQEEEEKKEEKDEYSEIIGLCLPSILPILMNWLEYKRQKKDKYTPTGLKSLVKKFNSFAHDYSGLESLVENSIINGYKGIIWEKYVPSNRTTNSGSNLSNLKDVQW